MMHVADGTFSCSARTAASIGPTAIPGWSQINRLLLRINSFVAPLRHADCIEQCPLAGVTRKTFAQTEFFSV
jgi:hypothetical protein